MEKEKAIPGFSRYDMRPDGVIINRALGVIKNSDPSNGLTRLINDEGKQVWFDGKAAIPVLFPPVIEKEPEKEVAPIVKRNAAKRDKKSLQEHSFKMSGNLSHLPEDLQAERARHAPKKMNDEKVIEFRRLLEENKITIPEAEIKYGVCQQTLRKIRARKLYKHI